MMIYIREVYLENTGIDTGHINHEMYYKKKIDGIFIKYFLKHQDVNGAVKM